MNIKKTNPKGVILIEGRFANGLKAAKSELLTRSQTINQQSGIEMGKQYEQESHLINLGVLDSKPNTKIMRLSKQVVDNCRLINIDAIQENLNVTDFKFDSLIILLNNDLEGIIKIDRLGTDFSFLFIKDLQNGGEYYFNSYSFLTKEFLFPEGLDKSLFVVQVLAYLYYGDITERHIHAKAEIKLSSFSKFLNNSKFPIVYVDSLWRQRISTDGFKVKGHFRLQPIGEGRAKRKLIWIEEFNKEGYNRKATSENDSTRN